MIDRTAGFESYWRVADMLSYMFEVTSEDAYSMVAMSFNHIDILRECMFHEAVDENDEETDWEELLEVTTKWAEVIGELEELARRS